MKQMKGSLLASLKMLGVMTILCGGLYTLLVTGIGQLFFPDQANGSLITVENQAGREQVVGSRLIGQEFTTEVFLQGRPGAVSNLSPVSHEQKELVTERIATLKATNPGESLIPSELVLASGSGLDPEISVAGAEFQIKRLATARGVSEEAIKKVIEKHTNVPLFGKLGARVNVLGVNLELAGYQLK